MATSIGVCAEPLVAQLPPTRIFTDRLRERAGDYFDSCEAAREVRYAGRTSHINCDIYRFRIEVPGNLRGVLVKVPFDRAARRRAERGAHSDAAERPRLVAKPDPATKAWFEFTTLSHIERHFISLSDPRFAAVRVFDYWTPERAIVMEEVNEPLLAELVGTKARFRPLRDGASRIKALRHAGAWLREFHTFNPLPHTEDRGRTRDEFLESIRRCSDYVAKENGGKSQICELTTRFEAAAAAHVPALLPLALSHGDFGPRNVFVGRGGRVRGFDTIGRWRAPIYEDLARFLVESSAGISHIGDELLAGYFGGQALSCERLLVRLFEIRALLGRWVACLHAASSAFGVRRIAKRCRAAIQIPILRRRIEALLRECEGDRCLP
jgi:hypothetical protein